MRLVPLIRNTPPLAQRPFGVPRLSTSPLPNATGYFEDFHSVSVGGALALGHYDWLATQLAGTGTIGCAAGTGSATQARANIGIMSIATGASANNGGMVDRAGRSITTGQTITSSTTNTKWIAQFRFSISGTANAITSSIYGLGLIHSNTVAYGTDWMTDPDTTLLGATTGGPSVVITRHAATYSGDAAGDIVLRYYEGSGTDDFSAVLLAAASVSAAQFYKVELYWDGASLHYYLDNVLIGSTALPNQATGAWTLRPSGGVITTTTAVRTLAIDSYYQEVEQGAPR